jgi:hypothetical protein
MPVNFNPIMEVFNTQMSKVFVTVFIVYGLLIILDLLFKRK